MVAQFTCLARARSQIIRFLAILPSVAQGEADRDALAMAAMQLPVRLRRFNALRKPTIFLLLI